MGLQPPLRNMECNSPVHIRGLCLFKSRLSLRRTIFSLIGILVGISASHAQSISAPDTNRSKSRVDSTLSNSPRNPDRLWRRPQVDRNGADAFYTGEALRYYGSP